MLNFVSVDHMTPYPMMDNYVQVNVGNAADSELPSVLANQTAPLKALQNMAQAWQTPPRRAAKLQGLRGLSNATSGRVPIHSFGAWMGTRYCVERDPERTPSTMSTITTATTAPAIRARRCGA